jgi:hypothetical protein
MTLVKITPKKVLPKKLIFKDLQANFQLVK